MTEIEKLVELERAATPGPWEAILQGDERGNPSPMYTGLVCILSAGEDGVSVVAQSRWVPKEDWHANAVFIAAARTAVPELLAALKCAEGERDEAIKDRDNALKIANMNHAQWERCETERDAAVVALESERVRLLAIMYRKAPVDTAKLCDETLDRSGRLLGLVRDEARAALASNSGGGDAQRQEKASQPQTFLGTRGETEIKGVSFKDMYKIVLARLEYFHPDKYDPGAFCQNICCEIEKKMGIYPNVPKRMRTNDD